MIYIEFIDTSPICINKHEQWLEIEDGYER